MDALRAGHRSRARTVSVNVSTLKAFRESVLRCKGAAEHMRNMNEAAAQAFSREIDTFDLTFAGFGINH